MEVCDEMRKLRAWLTEHEIPWDDASDGLSEALWICRTHFAVNSRLISLVNGWGTYGGADIWSENRGLLEMTVGEHGDPEGWLTAADVIREIEEL